MGLYDRDYVRYRPHVRLANPLGPDWRTSGVFWIIAVTVGIFFIQLILGEERASVLYCSPDRVVKHFEIWRLLTAAFCHSTGTIWHLAWNMLIVFFFGPQIERLYGRRDFLAFYLTVAVVANAAFCAVPYIFGGSPYTYVLGASGCGMALIVLCALYFPNQTVIFFFIPMPLWLLGALLVLGDVVGALNPRTGGPIAYSVHLAGAGLGALYRFVDLRLTTILARFERLRFRRRVRRAWEARASEERYDGVPRFIEDIEKQRLDRILEKISRFGRESLTEEELDFLNRMSERYRGKG